MFDFSAFTYRIYSQTVPVLSFFSVPDIMRRRSICRRRTKSIVVFVFVFVSSSCLYRSILYLLETIIKGYKIIITVIARLNSYRLYMINYI